MAFSCAKWSRVAHDFVPSTKRQRQEELCELLASLVYRARPYHKQTKIL